MLQLAMANNALPAPEDLKDNTQITDKTQNTTAGADLSTSCTTPATIGGNPAQSMQVGLLTQKIE